jgi:hypothetical protein
MTTDPTNEPSSTPPPRWCLLDDRIEPSVLSSLRASRSPAASRPEPGARRAGSIITRPASPATRGSAGRMAPALLALAALGPGLTACPATGPTPVAIERVTPLGDPTSTRFELSIEGRGFGLGAVSFDLAAGAGTATAAALALRVVRPPGLALDLAADALTLESPRRLRAEVRLDRPLERGLYGVELRAGTTLLAALEAAFVVADPAAPASDGGASPDGSPADAGAPDAAADPDAGDLDAGAAPDTGVAPDAGLGPFLGDHRFRRPVQVEAAARLPAGTTVLVGVPHATMVASGVARSDGLDLAVRQGPDLLPFQWDDRARLGTDDLAMVVRLARDLEPGTPLALYFGAPAGGSVTDDRVFEWSERFQAELPTNEAGNDLAWYRASNWVHCPFDRPTESVLPGNGAYCVVDRTPANLVRQTMSTPRVLPVSSLLPRGLTYELSFWLAGRLLDGPADILYLSYFTSNRDFDRTVTFEDAAYRGFVPNAALAFDEINGSGRRRVRGWAFPPDQVQWWRRVTVRFRPDLDRPSFHLRHISTDNGASDLSFVALDDWTIRRAAEPEPRVTLGATETR